jgi:hypothetical protein
MPIKDFPNTDVQMQQVLQAAKDKADGLVPPASAGFSPATLGPADEHSCPILTARYRNVAAHFRHRQRPLAFANPARKALNMVNRHFIQVFNFAVERGSGLPRTAHHYQLPVDYTSLPKMTTDEENAALGQVYCRWRGCPRGRRGALR